MTDRWRQTERLFLAALDRPVESRAAYVAEACGDDQALRREVESLLDQAAESEFLEQPALQVAADLLRGAGVLSLAGEQRGVYRFAELLGSGGMGEVFRAHDTGLGRDVAIKLPRAVTTDAERLQRFEREARLLAAFNHPHIGTLYGIQEFDGRLGLVLELVEGETLAALIARGAIAVPQALQWAQQIADALDAAHEKGIVHRDLKPANVKITPHGTVKVLDFGVARTIAGGDTDQPGGGAITRHEGLIVGTAAYMSPEQARGQPVDRRADVWAFGCVFYEMLAGKPPFTRATIPDTLAAVLQDEPDWQALPPTLPDAIAGLLRRCLEKDVRRRRRDIGDVRAELEDVLSGRRTAAPPPRAAAHGPRQRLHLASMFAAAAAIATVILLLASQWLFASRPEAVRELGFKRLTDAIGVEEMPAISPDGKDLAFVARVNGHRQIWIRRLAGGHPLQVTSGDVDHTSPRWTPDSSTLVYFIPPRDETAAGALWEIPTVNGTPSRLAASMTGADVSHDGRWLATFQKFTTGIALVILSRDGEPSGRVIPIAENAIEFNAPRWAPDDRSVAFHLGKSGWLYDLVLADMATLRTTKLREASAIRGITWLPDGNHLVLASAVGGTMVYPPVFSLQLVSTNSPYQRQLTMGDVSYEQPDASVYGQIYAARTLVQSDIWRFPVGGAPSVNVRDALQITRQTGQVQTPSVSPDGRELTFLSDSGGHSNVWITRTDGTTNPRPLTSESDDQVIIGIPVWSPVSDRIVFVRNDRRRPGADAFTESLINRDGSDRRELVSGASAAWASTGEWLYYQSQDPRQADQCISKIRVDGTAGPVLVRCQAAVPVPGPDGTLYFVPGGFWNANEIYKANPENATPELLTRYPRSRVPLWPTGFALSRDGRQLAVPLTDNGTTNIWAIPTGGGPYRQITDFGTRPILIGRQVSWSSDDRFIYAAVAEVDADIVMLDGLDTRSPAPRPSLRSRARTFVSRLWN